MATEETSLLDRTHRINTVATVANASGSKISICTSLKRRYQIHVFTKGATIVIVYYWLIFSIFVSTNPLVLNVPDSSDHWIFLVLLVILIYPVCGAMGEFFSRYKVMNIGVILMIFGRSLLALHFLKISSEVLKSFIFTTAFLIYYLGIATNYIQFGFYLSLPRSCKVMYTGS